MSRPVFEPLNTIQFTFTASLAPDSAPRFRVLDIADAMVASLTAVQSTTTSFYALYTAPNTEGAYIAEWYALRTFNGSARAFYKSMAFNISKVRA